MTGFNLPDGCNVSDIPGNRPGDAAYDEMIEKLIEDPPKCPECEMQTWHNRADDAFECAGCDWSKSVADAVQDALEALDDR